MFDTGKFNIDRTNIISLVPKSKNLIERVNLARKIEPPQGLPKSTNPAGFYVPYQYPLRETTIACGGNSIFPLTILMKLRSRRTGGT